MRINKIFINPKVQYVSSSWVQNLKNNYVWELLPSPDSLYIEDRRKPGKDTLYLTYSQGRIFMRCPCSKGSVSCGYFVLDTMVGCPFDCSYCYLQAYQNVEAISIYANLEERIKEIVKKLGKLSRRIRLGTGEFCDSLTLESIYPQVDILHFYFKPLRSVFLELKTKSDNVQHILSLEPLDNFVISWSLNPPFVAEKEEKFAPSVSARIKSALTVADKGWYVGFHFDPLIYYPGWEDDYLRLIKKLKNVPSCKVKWISLGTLRFPPLLKNIILERSGRTNLLSYGEFVFSREGKVRYYRKIRVQMYRFMLKELRNIFKDTPIYLCMETPLVWQEVFGFVPQSGYFARLFG